MHVCETGQRFEPGWASAGVPLAELRDARGSWSQARPAFFVLRDGDPISEAELSWIWEGQRQPAGALRLPDGRPLEVLYPGRRAGGAGPDFRDAVVSIDGERRLGDVELHIRASSFNGHGHERDHAYDGLVLHVVFRDDCPDGVRLASGRPVPTASLAGWVEERRAHVQSWLTRTALWEEPCRTAAERLGDDAVASVLETAGKGRFEARKRELAAAISLDGPEETLWAAILDALAYGGDREGFQRVAAALPPPGLRRYAGGVERALLTVAGLWPADGDEVEGLPRVSPAVRVLSSRPANRPERRLAAAARLFERTNGDILAGAEASVRTAGSGRDVVAAWTVGPLPSGGPALAGQDRATEIAVNAVLPFVAIDPAMAPRCLELAAEIRPLSPYGKTAFLEANLRRADGKRRPRSIIEQQGLIAMHRNWCSQGGCGRCPLS